MNAVSDYGMRRKSSTYVCLVVGTMSAILWEYDLFHLQVAYEFYRESGSLGLAPCL